MTLEILYPQMGLKQVLMMRHHNTLLLAA